MEYPGNLFVVAAPSGAGKSSLVKSLLELDSLDVAVDAEHGVDLVREQRRQQAVPDADDLHVRVIVVVTGDLLRELTLDTTRDYQRRGLPPGPKRTRSEP